jgi:hypothetical protein
MKIERIILFFFLSCCLTKYSYAASPYMQEILDYQFTCDKSNLPGCKYYQKPFTDKRIKKAMDIWLPLAEKGNAEAQWRLGTEYWDVSYDFTDDSEVIKFPDIGKKSLYWLTKSVEQGFEWAQVDLAIIYEDTDYHGVPVLKDLNKAIYLYKLAASQGNAYAAHQLSHRYHSKASWDWFACIHRSYCKKTAAVKEAIYWIRRTNELGFSINAAERWNDGQYWKFD